jgi:hypothetical protein
MREHVTVLVRDHEGRIKYNGDALSAYVKPLWELTTDIPDYYNFIAMGCAASTLILVIVEEHFKYCFSMTQCEVYISY